MTDSDQQGDLEVAHPRAIRSFVMRSGRMTPSQERAFAELWPQWGRKITDGHIDADQWFGRSAPLVLEIGFGMGDSLLAMAAAEPDKNFLGIEVHLPGVGRLLNNLHKANLTNVRLMQEDAIEVLNQCLPDQSLERVQLYFPDPWHKKKHNKRRMVQPQWVAKMASKLKPGGLLHLATDWQPYAEHMLEVMQASPDFVSQAPSGQDYADRPSWRPETKFERRGHKLGHGVWDLLYTRRDIA